MATLKINRDEIQFSLLRSHSAPYRIVSADLLLFAWYPRPESRFVADAIIPRYFELVPPLRVFSFSFYRYN